MDNTGAHIAKLQQQITTLEAKNLQEFQKEILASLYELRKALITDITNLGTAATKTDPQTGDERDKKIAELEAENKRLNYRIVHLTRNLKQKLG